MQCASCGHENGPEEEFCLNCGVELARAASPPPDPSQPPETTGEQIPPTTEQPPGQMAGAENELAATGAAGTETPAPPKAAEYPAQPQPTPDPLAEEELKFHMAVPFPITISCAGATDEGLWGISHKGLKGKNNEDAFHTDGADYPKHNVAIRHLIVADGMGSGEAGEILSRQAVYDTAAGLWFLTPSHDQHLDFGKLDFWRYANGQFGRFLSNQVASANSRVYRYIKAKKLASTKDETPGSTIVVATAICDLELGHIRVYGFSNGDARAYLVTDGKFQQLSYDQTVMNCPSSYLGQFEHLTGKPFDYEVWMGEEQMKTGWLILCSDGFWNMVAPDDISKIIMEQETAQQATAALIDAAMKVETPYGRQFDERVRTGDDNITLAILKFEHKETKL